MANQSLAILCFFSFILLFSTFVSAEQCHTDDKKALLQIKEHFRNPDTIKTWTPNTDCCKTWFQSITKFKNLIFLDLSSINIGGKIPEFLFELTSITNVILSDSKFSGPLPTSTGKLANLQTLLLDRNGFTRTIPISFTKITKLIVFSVSNNKLCGQIPFGGKLQAFDNSSYYNKNCLCGAPLPAC
ncbi:hypothetical protein Droror1_Dr00009821 [Drosera rotundifolia]